MVASGCSVGASELISSTLLEGAQVGSDVVLKESLVGKNTMIGDACKLEGVIVDHNAVVPPGTVLNGGQWPL
jgi:ADP-glucose pyrophosphorylase